MGVFLWLFSRSVAAVPVVNGGFDTGPFDVMGTVTGWTVETGPGLNGQVTDTAPANVAFFGSGAPNTNARISQTFNLAPGGFRVQFDLVNNLQSLTYPPGAAFFANMQLASLATFNFVDQIDDSLTGFAFRTVSFTGSTATATTGTLSLSFFNTQTNPLIIQTALVDNVTVTDGIAPEIDVNSARLPIALCFFGLLLLGRRRSHVAVC